MKTADLTGIPTKSVMGSINYIPLKLLESPGLIVEPPKHRTSIARIRLATPAQLRVMDKLMDPREMGFPVSEAYGLPVNAKSLVGPVMWEPLSIANGNGGVIQPKDTSG